MAVSKSRNVKKTNKVVKKNEPVQNIIDIEVDEEEQKPLFDDIVPEPVPEVKHSYDDKNGYFIAEKEDGKQIQFYTPEVLPNEYCNLIKKFISLTQGVSIGKYSAGTYKSISYDELEKVPECSLEYAHCYNIVSEKNISVLAKVISKLKVGGKLFIADTSTDLTPVLHNINNIGIRFCGYGYKLFNHNYWHKNKNVSIALVMKG